LPIQYGGLKGQGIQRVGNLVAMFRIGACEFLRRPLRTASARFALESQEEPGMVLLAPFLAHEQLGTIGANSVMASAASIALAAHIAFSRSPSARVADLVVFCRKLTKASDEARRSLAAPTAPPRCAEAFALIEKPDASARATSAIGDVV